MKTSLKRLIAFALMCAVMLAAVLPVSAAENLFIAGQKYVLVGKGAEEQTVVMDLNGKSEVKTVFYPVTSVQMTKPDYSIDVEDVPNSKYADIKVVYNSNLQMYGIEIKAKEMINTSFVVKYLKKIGVNYQAVALNNIKLKVIDGDDHIPDPDVDREDEDENDALYRAYRSQANTINVLEGLEACAEGQSLIVDVSGDNRVSNSWLKNLKKYPTKSLVFSGDSYSWTVKGSDIKSTSTYLSHYVGVSRAVENQAEIENACGIKNVPVIAINGMSKFPASKAELRVQLTGKSFQDTVVNVYRYESGKVYTVAENVETDGEGNITLTVTEPGIYLASRFKSSKAI